VRDWDTIPEQNHRRAKFYISPEDLAMEQGVDVEEAPYTGNECWIPRSNHNFEPVD
jgi:hypothetical protein